MRTLVISLSCLAVALLLTSFAPLPGTGGSSSPSAGAAISTFDLTLAAGAMDTPDYADAH